MFEESPQDTDDADAAGETAQSRPQHAQPAHHQIALDTGLGRTVQRTNDLRVAESVELGADPRLLAGLGMGDLVLDRLEQPGEEVARGYGDSPVHADWWMTRARKFV